MVLSERNSDLVRNGKRSRGPSPNGQTAVTGSSSSIVINNINTGVGGAGGNVTETSSDDDNSIKRNGKSKAKQSEYEEKIRVGRDYQAVCPSLIPEHERKPEILNDRALLVWSPTKEIPDSKLEEYISVAKEKYGYNGEQALGMLFWHKHDLGRAVTDLANFTPFPDEWTVEDKVLFEQAFQFHGKSFHRIRQMLPDKSIASLVKYYYSWKKTRHRQSVMDRQEKAKASKEGSDNGSDNGSNEDSDNDEKEQAIIPSGLHNQMHSKLISGSSSGISIANSGNTSALVGETVSKQSKSVEFVAIEGDGVNINSISTVNTFNNQQRQQTPSTNSNTTDSTYSAERTNFNGNNGAGACCANCGVLCNQIIHSPHGKLCASCHHHWRRTGNKRPTSGPYFGKRTRDRNLERHKRKPPRGMYINHDDIVTLASVHNDQDGLLANIDREIVSLLSQVQLNKQNISALKNKHIDSIDDIRINENANRINPRWTNDELLMAVQGVRKYGKDFQMIAETLGTKTEAHVRTFYVNNRRKYNLDQVLKKFESEREVTAEGSNINLNSSPTNSSECKKEETKKKEVGGGAPISATSTTSNNVNLTDELDNANSNEPTICKPIIDEANSSGNNANVSVSLGNIAMEVDDNPGPLEILPSPTKKIALGTRNQDLSKPSSV